MSYGTSGDDYFGGQADENIIVFKGKSLYPVVDETTGATTWYERKGDGLLDAFANDIKLGTITPPSKDFVPHEGTQLGALWPDGFSDVLVGEDAKEFLSPEFQSQLRKKASEIVEKENVVEKGDNPEAAKTRAEELLDTGEMTTPPDATAEEIAQSTLNNTNIQAVEGTRKGFGNLRYPKDMNGSQDFIQFAMLEYKPKDLLGNGLGAGDRPRVGFNQDGGGRNIIGTCALPIQSGIKDTNAADWGENKMNAMQLATAELALGGLDSAAAGAKALDKVANAVQGNAGDAKEAVQQFFAGKMTGVTGLFARTKGATINPNLELLFNGPTLRPFSFQFRLSARNKTEAEEIVKIIRFFKQGMAPIRTEGNLFLLAPHTFQVHFVHAPSDGEHPYIGKMKECALKTFSTDYTPENNYTTLKDGFMTSYTISMEFQELEPVYNDDYTNLDGNADTQIGF
jgi:hypothetical protein